MVYPNLATRSQKYKKSHGFIGKRVIFEVLFCKHCWRITHTSNFIKIDVILNYLAITSFVNDVNC